MILGFPSNDFGSQEPGTNREIAKFCKLKYNVDFPMMAKVKVKGKGKHKLFSYLLKNSSEKGEIQWNFEKFLIDKNGKVMKRFPSKISPESREFISFLESIL